MDLRTALRVVSSTTALVGVSDKHLARMAQPELGASSARPVPWLDGGIDVRAIDILHELAVATRFAYHPTVLDVYSQWALLRYIGAFDFAHFPTPRLRLSDAGQNVVGNQRRVMSEDLGIGVSVVLARRWFQQRFPTQSLDVIDLDVAIKSELIERPAGRRTDYLLVSVDPATRRLHAHGLLESKGTVTPGYHIPQIIPGPDRWRARPWAEGASQASSVRRSPVVARCGTASSRLSRLKAAIPSTSAPSRRPPHPSDCPVRTRVV